MSGSPVPSGEAQGTKVRSKSFPVFDCDGHIVEPGYLWSDFVEPEYRDAVRRGLWKEDDPSGGFEIILNGVSQFTRVGNTSFFGAVFVPGMDKDRISQIRMMVDDFPIPRGAYEPAARLLACDLMGIDQVMLLPTVCGLWYTAIQDPTASIGLARAYNDWIAHFCEADPARLHPAAILPQIDNDDAIAEIRRVADLGFRCVIVRPNIVGGRHPLHPSFDPVWEAIQDAGLVAGVHPFPPTAPADCTGWLLDRVAEAAAMRRGIISETLCFAHDAQAFLLIAFHHDLWTKFPTLKVAVLESNAAWLPYVLDKADGRVTIWSATRGTEVHARPSEVFTKRGWIAFESDEDSVFETWKRYEDIGVWASDYPHFDGEDAWEAIEHMERSRVPDHVQAKMLGTNACAMYGIEPKLFVTERLPVPTEGSTLSEG